MTTLASAHDRAAWIYFRLARGYFKLDEATDDIRWLICERAAAVRMLRKMGLPEAADAIEDGLHRT